MQDDMVYYLHNGNPVFCHHKDDKNSYRFILGNLIVNQLCTVGELHDTLGIARKNIERYAKTFREKGSGHFFARKETRGQCYKMTKELLAEVQQYLDAGWSKYKIAKQTGISEASIRYHLNKGNLKKK